MRAITDDMIHMLLERLSKRNITIWTEAGKIKYKAPAGALTSEELQCKIGRASCRERVSSPV